MERNQTIQLMTKSSSHPEDLSNYLNEEGKEIEEFL